MNPLLLLGSATHDNAGDLAMMQALIDCLRRDRPGRPLALLTRNPEHSASLLGLPCHLSPDPWLIAPGQTAPSRVRLIAAGLLFLIRLMLWRNGPRRLAARAVPPDLAAVFDRMASAHGLLVHGSGSFNSIFRRGWLYPKTFTALAARRLGVPVWMTSQGIGPFTHPLDRFMARVFFRLADRSGVRDGETSRREAIACGAPPDRIVFTGDDALRLAPADPAAIDSAWRAEGLPDHSPLLGINVRDASSYHPDFRDGGQAALAAALDRIIETRDVRVVFLPITFDPHDDDRAGARAVRERMRHADRTTLIEGRFPPDVLCGLAGRFDAVAGVSYHFLLFALDAAVPGLALTRNPYYAAKHEGLARLYTPGLSTVGWREDGTGELTAALLELLDHQEERRSALRAAVPRINEAAEAGWAEVLRHIDPA